MPFEKESRKNYAYPVDQVFQAAKSCVALLGGKVIKEDQGQGLLHAQMDKKLFGDYLGDRSQLEMRITPVNENKAEIYIYAYPLNAVGQKLLFGARDNVVETMVAAFYAQVEKELAGK